jgi:hypothetical protein
MGHHHSRPKASRGDIIAPPATRGNVNPTHPAHRGREASTRSHWWSFNKTKSSSAPRLGKADPAAPLTHVSLPIQRLGRRVDSLKPLTGSGSPEKAHEALTVPYIQTQDGRPSPSTLPVLIDTSHPAITPKDVLDGNDPQAASSSRQDHRLATGRQFPLSTSSSEPSHKVAADLDEYQEPSSLRLTAQIARDHDMASLLQEEEDCRRAAESRQPSKECVVCCESVLPLQFPANPPSSECAHSADVCFPCLQQWVATKVDGSSRAMIDCPQCTTFLSHEDVRRACNFETFERYDRFAALNVINSWENFYWCLRPGCTAGQEHISRVPRFMRCHACSYEQCLKHKTKWHRGESCTQYDARVKNKTHEQEERESVKLMDEQQSKIRPRECPNIKCKNRIADGQKIPEKCPKQGCNTSLEREPVWKKCPACQTLIEKKYVS